MQPKGSGGARWVLPDPAGIIIGLSNERRSTRGSPTLDDPQTQHGRPAAEPSAPHAGPDPEVPPRADRPRDERRGLKAQLMATKDAVRLLLTAHIDLAKTEIGEIGGAIARTLAYAGVALAFLLLTGLLVIIGGSLFLAEWLLGSMGWGVLHGMLLFTGIAVAAVLMALGRSAGAAFGGLGLGLVIGIAIAVVLGLNLLPQAYAAIGDALAPTIDATWRATVVGAVLGAIVLGLVGLVGGLRGGGAGAAGGLIGGIVLGAILGAISAITFGWQAAVGLGLTIAYVIWLGWMAAALARDGVDTDALKRRFYPSQTIDTTKETLEWLQTRMPRGPAS